MYHGRTPVHVVIIVQPNSHVAHWSTNDSIAKKEQWVLFILLLNSNVNNTYFQASCCDTGKLQLECISWENSLLQLAESEDLDNDMGELLQFFESKCNRPLLHTVVFY